MEVGKEQTKFEVAGLGEIILSHKITWETGKPRKVGFSFEVSCVRGVGVLDKREAKKLADFIYERAKHARNDKEFDFWIWQGLSLDYDCVENGIYLN